MGCACGVDDEALRVRHVGKQGKQFEIFAEKSGIFRRSLDFKGENGACSVREIACVELVVGMGTARESVAGSAFSCPTCTCSVSNR